MTDELPMYIDAEEMIADCNRLPPRAGFFHRAFLLDAWMQGGSLPDKDPTQWRRLRIDRRLCKRLRRQVLPKLWELGADGYWRYPPLARWQKEGAEYYGEPSQLH